MATAAPLVVRDFSNGIQTSVTSGLVGPNALRYAVNMYNDSPRSKIGSLTSRYGFNNDFGYIDIDIPAMAATEEIVGMWSGFLGIASLIPILVVAITNGVTGDIQPYYYSRSTNSWSLLGSFFPADYGYKIAFESFQGFLIAVTGDGTKSIETTGGVWGNNYVTGAQDGNLVKSFQGKLYIAQSYHDTIYFSPADILTNPTSSWTATDTNNFTILGGSSSGLTALEVNGNLLLIFKYDAMYTWDGYQTQSNPLYNVGTVNQEVVQTIDGKTLFVGQNQEYLSVYLYDGSYPVDVSEPVREFLKLENLINSTDVPAQFGAWKNGKEYCLNIGDVTIDDKVFYNTILIYNTEKKSWTVFTLGKKIGTYNNFFRFTTQYAVPNSTSTIYNNLIDSYKKTYTVIGGKSLGTINTQDVGLAPVIWAPSTTKGDNIGEATNNPIDIYIQTHELEWGSRVRLKTVHKFKTFASGNYGCINVEVRVDGGSWETLGGLTGKTTTIEVEKQGYYFEFRWIGQNTGEPFVFEGYDFGNWVDIEDYET